MLTKGWIQYVKEKNLKAGDIITFQKSAGPDKQFYIERRPVNRTGKCHRAVPSRRGGDQVVRSRHTENADRQCQCGGRL
ncbi:hypothetical protein Nepgr_010938 [Nepenthes gracilis]|uniref:TF-B3 domain-containing protein n=1 Tax=Nepenthes gracilis TaxID=150966 RepID=A0AAD3SDC3_NEPGR|nr:hypothetical protein Nepgr_010938 [Nepenthes gracilis]